MSLIVQKFGGSSVRDAQRIRNVAGIIAETYLEGNDVLVVLSAQGDTTDDLIAKAEEINSHPSKREMDMLLATGEQISVALCAMALESMGLPCVSLTAWQVGIQTTAVHGDARIKRIDSERVQAELDQHRIVLITGFQGMDRAGELRPWAGAAATPVLWRWRRRSGPNCARSTRMWTVFTLRTPESCPTPDIWTRSPMMKCWSWRLRGPACSTTAAWSWQRSSGWIWKCSPVWRESPEPK